MALTRVTTPVISTTTTGNSGQVLTAGTDGNLVWLNQAALAVAGANVTGTVANANYAAFSNVATTANSVAGANVTGTVANATFATSAGTANSATVAASANSVAGANVTGTVANAQFATSAGTANTANSVALANVTGIGNIAAINLNGNGTTALLGNGTWGAISSSSISNGNSNVAVVANGNVSISSAGNANILVVTGTGANITGTLGVTGNTTVGNLSVGNSVNAGLETVIGNTANSTALKLRLTSTGTNTYIQVGNGTSSTTGNLIFAPYNSATGNLTINTASGNLTSSGNISANTFIGNGSALSSITGANVTGTVANATYAVTAGTANAVAAANITGTISFATNSNVANTANAVALANVTGIGNIASINLNGNGSQALLGNGTWGNVTGGTSITNWALANSYSSGAIVVYSNGIYQSNDTISANTAFVIGSTGSTWKILSSAGTLPAANGAAVGNATNGQALSTNSASPTTLMTFTIPGAGTWELVPTVTLVSAAGTAMWALYDDGGNLVSNTTTMGSYEAAANVPRSFTRSIQVTTTGATTYTVRGWASNSTTFGNNSTNGFSSGTYTQLNGFIPATGATTAILKATRTAVQSITSGVGINVAVVCNSIENQGGTGVTYNSTTGTVTLTAGNTYRLRGAVGSVISTLVGQAASIQFQWRNTTTGAFVGGTGSQIAPGASNTNTIGVPVAEAVITPNVTTTLQLWVTNLYNATGIGQQTTGAESGFPWIDIEQLGTTNTSAFTGMISNSYDVNNTYPSGTIVVKDGFLYQANSTIVAGTAFAVGTTGATWTLLNLQAAEYGSAELASTTNLVANTATDIMSFTLPSAGVWEVTYQVSAEGAVGVNQNAIRAWLTDTSNNVVDNSSQRISWASNSTLNTPLSQTVRITTSGSQTFKLRGLSANTSVWYAGAVGGTDQNTNVVWKKISGFLPLQPKVFTETITIGATTTAPTKATTKVLDYITLTDDGSGWCDVEMAYVHSNATGSAAGSGTYLFTLPAGYAFDTSVQPLNTQATQLAGDGEAYKMIPAVGLTQTVSTYSLNSNYAVPYTATQFRIIPMNPSNWFFIGSGYYAITGSNITYKISFRFKKA